MGAAQTPRKVRHFDGAVITGEGMPSVVRYGVGVTEGGRERRADVGGASSNRASIASDRYQGRHAQRRQEPIHRKVVARAECGLDPCIWRLLTVKGELTTRRARGRVVDWLDVHDQDFVGTTGHIVAREHLGRIALARRGVRPCRRQLRFLPVGRRCGHLLAHRQQRGEFGGVEPLEHRNVKR